MSLTHGHKGRGSTRYHLRLCLLLCVPLLPLLQVEPDFQTDLRTRLRRVNALAPINATQRAQVALDDLLGLRGFELEAVEGVVRQELEFGLEVWSLSAPCCLCISLSAPCYLCIALLL